MTNVAPATPLDVRLGLTDARDVNHVLRWGILGCGNVSSQWVHCLRAVPGAQVVAVGARSHKRAQVFAAQHGIPTAYANYSDLVEDPKVDIVYIGPLHDCILITVY